MSGATEQIGTAQVGQVQAVTDASATYDQKSAENDATYLKAMAAAEKTYLDVVTDKSDLLRRKVITQSAYDAAVTTAWDTYQDAAKEQRNLYQQHQSADAATYRNAVATAQKSLVDTMTNQNKQATEALQDAQALLAKKK